MSEVATTLLLFTASVGVAASVVGYLGIVVQDMARSGEEVGRAMASALRTDVQLISDPTSIPTGPVRFYVKNTGTEPLDPNATELLVDGVVRSSATFTVLNASSAGSWRPGEVLEASDGTLALAAGDHTVLVVAERGARDTLRVRV